MVGGVIATVWGLCLAGISWEVMFPNGTSLGQFSATPDSVGDRLPLVGGVLFVVGARAAGAALVGSSVCAFASLLKGFHCGKTSKLSCTARSSWGASAWSGSASPGSGAAGEVNRRRRIAEDFGGPPGGSPAGSIPPGAGPGGVRQRRRRGAADPPDLRRRPARPLADSGYWTPPRLRGVLLPGLRALLGPAAAYVRHRLPRAVVPGAGVAGVAVIRGARRGGRHRRWSG